MIRIGAYGFLILASLFAAARPVFAQIVSPSKQGVSRGGTGELPLLIGSGVEYQSDSEATEIDYPATLEYNLTEDLKLTLEWSYVNIRSKSSMVRSASGFGDLETFVEYEFLSERRYRPALTLETGVKWPTAASPDIGTGKADYSLGVIASKEFIGWTTDLSAVYTFVGNPRGLRLKNTLELSLAAEWELSRVFTLEGEALYTFGGGGAFRGQAGTVGGVAGAAVGGGSEFEFTIGLAEHLNEYLKLEEGVLIQPDGSWQAVAYWEWDFGGGK